MAKATTWTFGADPDTDFENAANWNNGVAVAGDTISIGETQVPGANRPAAGEFLFNINTGVAIVNLNDWLNGATIGTVAVNHASAVVMPGANFGGGTVTAGYLFITNNIANSAAVTVGAAAGILEIGAATLTGDVVLAVGGTLKGGGAGAVVDGAVTATGAATVNWASGQLDIIGSLDANGNTITHSNIDAGGGNNLTCDLTGNLDLGSTAAGLQGLDVTVSANTTTKTTEALVCRDFRFSGGTYVPGGLQQNIYGDLYGSGWTVTVGTAVWKQWITGKKVGTSTRTLYTYELAAGITITTDTRSTRIKKLIAPLTSTLTGTQIIEVNGGLASWWAGVDGTISCPVNVRNTTSAPGGNITIVDKALIVLSTGTNALTLPIVDIGTGNLTIFGDGAGDSMTVTLTGALTCRDIALGDSDSNGLGALTLAATAAIRSVAEGGANAANTINLASCVITQTGTFNGTNITPTNTAARFIGGTISNLDASGTATIDALAGVTDGGGNTNINFGGQQQMIELEADEAYRARKAFGARSAYSLRR